MASKLTKIFKTIGENDEAQESLGAQILAFLVENKCATLGKANEQFQIAYDENGWSRTAGRPKDGSKEVPAPRQLRTMCQHSVVPTSAISMCRLSRR
jgi:hypothetical protein